MNQRTHNAVQALLLGALGLVFSVDALAEPQGVGVLEPKIVLKPGSRLWLEGNAAAHPYSSTATVVSASVEFGGVRKSTESWSPLEALVRGHRIEKLEAAIPIRGLKSGEYALDRNMYAALRAERYPIISFQLLRYEVLEDPLDAGLLHIHAFGRLSLAGKEKLIGLDGQARFRLDSVRIQGEKELLMTDFDARPLMLTIGPLRTENRVMVRFDLSLGLEYEETDATAHLPGRRR